MSERVDKIFRISIVNDRDLMIYIVSEQKKDREWEQVIEKLCQRNDIKLKRIDNLNLNPLN